MSDSEENSELQKADPVATGRTPTHEEKMRQEEEKDKETAKEIEEAQADVETALALDPENSKAQELQSQLRGATPKTIDKGEVERAKREAKEAAAQETQEKIMAGTMALAGIGAVMALMGVSHDGKDYPPELAGTDALPRNIGGLPMRDRESQSPQLS